MQMRKSRNRRFMVSDKVIKKVNDKDEIWTQALRLWNPYSQLPWDVALYVEDSDLFGEANFCFVPWGKHWLVEVEVCLGTNGLIYIRWSSLGEKGSRPDPFLLGKLDWSGPEGGPGIRWGQSDSRDKLFKGERHRKNEWTLSCCKAICQKEVVFWVTQRYAQASVLAKVAFVTESK